MHTDELPKDTTDRLKVHQLWWDNDYGDDSSRRQRRTFIFNPRWYDNQLLRARLDTLVTWTMIAGVLASVVALIFVPRFRTFWVENPPVPRPPHKPWPWYQVLGGLGIDLVFLAALIALPFFLTLYLYPLILQDNPDHPDAFKRQEPRLLRLFGCGAAFVYAVLLYYVPGIVLSQSLQFVRAHYLDGFTCAGLITVGLILVDRLRNAKMIDQKNNPLGAPSRPLDRHVQIAFTTAYFVVVSAFVAIGAAFAANGDPTMVWVMALIGSIVGLGTGLLIGTGQLGTGLNALYWMIQYERRRIRGSPPRPF